MAWRAATVMDERVHFIFEVRNSDLSFSEICRRHQISRVTGYKWVSRHTELGVEGLRDLSHRPASCPHRIASDVEQRILELRKRRTWGAPKLHRLLEEELGWSPAISTIHRILDRHGLIEKKKPRRVQDKPPKPPFEADRPNALWTADFKGQFRLKDGQLCYPLTVQDAYSRYLLDCRALPRTHARAHRTLLPAALSDLRPAGPHPHRQRSALRFVRLARPTKQALGLVGSAGHSARVHPARKASTERTPRTNAPNAQARGHPPSAPPSSCSAARLQQLSSRLQRRAPAPGARSTAARCSLRAVLETLGDSAAHHLSSSLRSPLGLAARQHPLAEAVRLREPHVQVRTHRP